MDLNINEPVSDVVLFLLIAFLIGGCMVRDGCLANNDLKMKELEIRQQEISLQQKDLKI